MSISSSSGLREGRLGLQGLRADGLANQFVRDARQEAADHVAEPEPGDFTDVVEQCITLRCRHHHPFRTDNVLKGPLALRSFR